MSKKAHSFPSHDLYDWPTGKKCYLTMDFECDYGTALSENYYTAIDRVDDLTNLIERYEIPLTAFVQTEVLDVRPETVEVLQDSSVPVEFHPHSHKHSPRDETSIREEVETATERYREFFGESPVGYRFPNGNIRPQDYEILASADYEFDASVFPSWRPGHFNNTTEPTSPFYLPDYDLFEVPFTVISPWVRIPTALSYLRLVGQPFSTLLNWIQPPTVVFNIHMHDLFNPDTFVKLPRRYQAIYSRNPDGFGTLKRVLKLFQGSGYEFDHLSSVPELVH